MAKKSIERREVFVGLIAPIGIDLDQVREALSQALRQVHYDVNEIRLTNIFRENSDWYEVDYKDDVDRYKKYIAAGDKLCEESERNDMLALYGIASLVKRGKREDVTLTPVLHIFRQLKRVEEIELLKETFGTNIMFVSCYAPRRDRISALVKKMLKTYRGTSKTKLESMALNIISLDEEERDKPHGQRLMDCYPHADFILDCSSHAKLKDSAERFIEILFGAPFMTPTHDEYASYIAHSASLRSADLSRQVGAAIFGHDFDLVSIGCNEVPKAGGGTYWECDEHDRRDYAVGYDSNQKVREDLARDALLRLQEQGWLSERYRTASPDELVEEAFNEKGEPGPFSMSMMKDIIEFGRMVHAEMNALTDAARFRRSTRRATLYCTTMPCHMCAKLIVASGIERVVYLQPYTKSLVGELFEDSIAIDETPKEKRVVFDSLKGVTPNGFRLAFEKTTKRKCSDGTAVTWDPVSAPPICLTNFPFYGELEVRAGNAFKAGLAKIAEQHPKQGILKLVADELDGLSETDQPLGK